MLCVHCPDQKLPVMQDELLAEQLQQAADRGQKWKSRCAKLRQELMETQTSAAALEAALNVSCCMLCSMNKLSYTSHCLLYTSHCLLYTIHCD